MLSDAETNRKQFNLQAEAFATWSTPRDEIISKGTADFIGLSPSDYLLDVACGSGNFVNYVSGKVALAVGIDIAEKQLEIASQNTKNLTPPNVRFVRGNVDTLPFAENFFSVITCKSAFHHFSDPEKIFAEMYRCCKIGGLICINDITTYDDDLEATQIIDDMDRLIDVSHIRRMSPVHLTKLFLDKKMRIIRRKIIDFERSVAGYSQHAIQDQVQKDRMNTMMNYVIQKKYASRYIFLKYGEITFVNRGFLILGQKGNI